MKKQRILEDNKPEESKTYTGEEKLDPEVEELINIMVRKRKNESVAAFNNRRKNLLRGFRHFHANGCELYSDKYHSLATKLHNDFPFITEDEPKELSYDDYLQVAKETQTVIRELRMYRMTFGYLLLKAEEKKKLEHVESALFALAEEADRKAAQKASGKNHLKGIATIGDVLVRHNDLAYVQKAMVDLAITDEQGNFILGEREKNRLLAFIQALYAKKIVHQTSQTRLVKAFCTSLGIKPTKLESTAKDFKKHKNEYISYITDTYTSF